MQMGGGNGVLPLFGNRAVDKLFWVRIKEIRGLYEYFVKFDCSL